MKKILKLTLLMWCIGVALTACHRQEVASELPEKAQQAEPGSQEFISVRGTQFFWRGQPYYVVGTNFWFGAYLGAPSDVGDRERLVKELDLLRSLGINNLRVLAVSEASELVRAVRPAIIQSPGVFNEELLVGLDFLLDEMAKREMHAVLYFNNFWQWSGGMSQYVSWVTGEPVFDPDVTNEWNAFMQNSAKFYHLAEAQALYRSVIKQIVTRRNSVNGKIYHQDPTVMSWQLANEPRPGSDEKGRSNAEVYRQWIHETAKYIKELAPEQLVSTGSEGAMGSIRDIQLYIDAHRSPYVDYLTFHMWLKNWSWFDALNPEATYASALASAKAYINHHIAAAEELNKPIVLEEFGAERDGGAFSPASTTHYRDRFYREFFTLIEKRAAAGDAIAGSNFWAWGGYGRAANEDFMWKTSDDFMGDPPQEPQGLNSVFASDESTLEIIHSHAKAMRSHAVMRESAP